MIQKSILIEAVTDVFLKCDADWEKNIATTTNKALGLCPARENIATK
jgi:hypothetical protein